VKKLDKWVPHELDDLQKRRRFEICSGLLLRHQNDPFIERIVTCDETWILYDNRRRSAQWLDKDEAPKQFAKPKWTQRQTMVTVWGSTAGIIHYNFLKSGETINADKYCLELTEMQGKLTRKCPALVHRRGPLLLHDNARPHVSQTTVRKIHDLG
jgi:histone-lysine N-methyltransferase SETMAR